MWTITTADGIWELSDFAVMDITMNGHGIEEGSLEFFEDAHMTYERWKDSGESMLDYFACHYFRFVKETN